MPIELLHMISRWISLNDLMMHKNSQADIALMLNNLLHAALFHFFFIVSFMNKVAKIII